jgi:hypothetical protein
VSVGVYPVSGYGMSKYDLFWRYLKEGLAKRVGANACNASATVYTCPEGRRCFVLLMVITWTSPNAGYDGYVKIVKPDGTTIVIAHVRGYSNSYGTHNTNGLVIQDVIVLDGGDSINIDGQSYVCMACFAEVVEL